MSFNVNIWLQNVQPTNIIIFMVILTVLFGRYSEVLHSSILSGRYADALQTERKCIDMIFLYQEFIQRVDTAVAETYLNAVKRKYGLRQKDPVHVYAFSFRLEGIGISSGQNGRM